MNQFDLFSLSFCIIYSILSYKDTSLIELFLANLGFLLIAGFLTKIEQCITINIVMQSICTKKKVLETPFPWQQFLMIFLRSHINQNFK